MSHTAVAVIRDACPICGPRLSPIGYVCIRGARVYDPAYHALDECLLQASYERYILSEVRRLVTYDRVVDWARTTPRIFVGTAQHSGAHPLRNYLNDVLPISNRRILWEVFPSACDALKGIQHLPHTSALTLFKTVEITSEWLTFNLYQPLPTWTYRLMSRLQTIPYGCKITPETFLTLLHTTL